MFSLYLLLKFIHILAAIVAVGFNISYGVWIVRAQRDPSHTAFALKGIQFIDNRIANPAYGLLLLTGVLMAITGSIPITTLWILIALILFAVLVILAIAVYTPTLRDQVKLVEAGDTTSAEFARLARRGQVFGQAMAGIVLLILVMMVFKPHL